MLQRYAGWDTEHVLTGMLPLPENRFDNGEKRIALFRRIEEKLASLPGVEAVALANSLPLFNYFSDRPVFRDAPAAGAEGSHPVASHVLITPGFLGTLGIPLLDGRNFASDINADSPQYILVNETLARRFWPGESAVGKRLGVHENNQTVWRQIIGVVGDVEPAASIVDPPTPLHVYRPLVQEPWAFVNFAVRSKQPAALTDTVRRAIAEIDADLPADQVGTVRQFATRTQHNIVVVGYMLGGFAALGLVLAAVGLYGVISHLVAQRTGEFGIRLALGALPRDLLAHVLLRGIRMTGLGLLLGLVGAWGLGYFLASFMPRLAAPDPGALATMGAVLFVVTILATLIPARRATRVDPMTALRAE
jgi:predicted permease